MLALAILYILLAVAEGSVLNPGGLGDILFPKDSAYKDREPKPIRYPEDPNANSNEDYASHMFYLYLHSWEKLATPPPSKYPYDYLDVNMKCTDCKDDNPLICSGKWKTFPIVRFKKGESSNNYVFTKSPNYSFTYKEIPKAGFYCQLYTSKFGKRKMYESIYTYIFIHMNNEECFGNPHTFTGLFKKSKKAKAFKIETKVSMTCTYYGCFKYKSAYDPGKCERAFFKRLEMPNE